ncbi:MAG: hypothetical protein PHV02_06475 [Rhodocyclaceae bacterium]|nr:hypothetical protein [Rhodocyclaceae bacterium]
MSTIALRQRAKADANHTIHVTLPPEMGDNVEIIILPIAINKPNTGDGFDSAKVFEETGFARNILSHPDEDCWNDL